MMRGGLLPDEILILASQITLPLLSCVDLTESKVAFGSLFTILRAALLQASACAEVVKRGRAKTIANMYAVNFMNN